MTVRAQLLLSALGLLLAHPGGAQSEGDGLSRTGPPLRLHPDSGIENFRLETKIDGKVVVGGDLGLEVQLPDDDVEGSGFITSCQWTSPYGAVYQVDKDNIEGREIHLFAGS